MQHWLVHAVIQYNINGTDNPSTSSDRHRFCLPTTIARQTHDNELCMLLTWTSVRWPYENLLTNSQLSSKSACCCQGASGNWLFAKHVVHCWKWSRPNPLINCLLLVTHCSLTQLHANPTTCYLTAHWLAACSSLPHCWLLTKVWVVTGCQFWRKQPKKFDTTSASQVDQFRCVYAWIPMLTVSSLTRTAAYCWWCNMVDMNLLLAAFPILSWATSDSHHESWASYLQLWVTWLTCPARPLMRTTSRENCLLPFNCSLYCSHCNTRFARWCSLSAPTPHVLVEASYHLVHPLLLQSIRMKRGGVLNLLATYKLKSRKHNVWWPPRVDNTRYPMRNRPYSPVMAQCYSKLAHGWSLARPILWIPSSLVNASTCSLSARALLAVLALKYLWNGTVMDNAVGWLRLR